VWHERQGLIEMVSGLCDSVRSSVRPMLGRASAKASVGQGATGDTTFGIDEVAENTVVDFLNGVGDVAFYTEDRGLVVVGRPEHILVIDPIDGTRPAAAGLESCCVSVAVAPYADGADRTLTLGDVFLGAVVEIKNDAAYLGLRGHGTRFERDGCAFEPALSEKTDLNSIFWTAGFRGRAAEPLVTVLSELIDLTSVDGGCFDLGSATFCISRVVTGEMDAYVDIGQRMADEIEQVRLAFLEIGHGAILTNYPYDLAAAVLIAREAGAVVTDARGRTLDTYPLVPSGGGGQLSSMVSANETLHRLLMEQMERGMERLGRRYGSRPAV